jgi:multidrug efflux pump
VGLVTLGGAQRPAVRVQVDPEALSGTGLTLEDVRAALVAANINAPKGTLDTPRQEYTLQTDDQLMDAKAFAPVLLAYVNGAPLRLQDVARTVDSVENAQLAGWANDHRAIILNVQRQPGANVIQVADRVKALLPQLEASLPQGLHVTILADRTETVRASVADVEFTLVLTIFLVVAVIYVFLRNLRATTIPGITVPLSLIGTFGLMYLLGYSLNNLSLMALTISTGFVVDDAIVMIENIARYIEAGETPLDAAMKGAGEIGFTIVSLTVSLVAVLVPLLFMTGLIGRLFREFAVTLSLAIGVSAVLSLTLTPMMCAWILKPEPPPEQRGRFYAWSERTFERVIAAYGRGVDWVLRHQPLTLAITIGTFLLTVVLAFAIPKGFFPVQDTGIITGITEADPGVSFARMSELQQKAVQVVREDPDVVAVASFIGADGTNPTTNSGRLSITLKPRDERRANATQIITRLQPRLADIGGIAVYLQAVQDLQIETRQSRTPYQYTLEAADPGQLAEWAPKLLGKLRSLPELKSVATDQLGDGPVTLVSIDRDTASRLGISTQAIDDTLYDAFGQRQVSIIFTQLNLYRVILEANPNLAKGPHALDRIYVRNASGSPVPLSAVVSRIETTAPLTVNHQGQFPSVTLSFDVAPGHSLGAAVTAIRRATDELGLPRGLSASFQGTAQEFRDSLANEPILVLAALITVYIVLGVLYESYIHPITILSTLPSAGVGALLALMLCGMEFDIVALIGIVLLIGIVKKNAIMMIDFALVAEREEKLSPAESIKKACLLRFRPIMMTSFAALLGGLPLALEGGTGSELRRPLGVSIVGGLLISQVLTLYTTPVIYLYMERFGRWIAARRRPGKAQGAPEEVPG